MTHVYTLDHPHALSAADARALLGGKAANLGIMCRELALPVPPGLVITTEACKDYLANGWPDGLDDEIRACMADVEAAVGRRFGDPGDPLLVSVRSGAPVSMPGMMDTILNLGLTDETAAGLAFVSGDTKFARDCRDRFRTMYREIVGGEEVPEDPWVQLRLAVEAVFHSWNSDRARAYRRHEGIPDDLGTAVTVQAMVFGNRGATSATGVLFTRNPATGEPRLYGDVMFDAQGEDVVAGTHRTEPLSALDERLPTVAAELRAHAERLERHYADLCDIEFTIERGKLWMLQVRVGKRSPQAALRIAVDMAEDETFPLSRADAVRRCVSQLVDPPLAAAARSNYLLRLVAGLPASPGMATGEIVTTPEAAERAAEAGRRSILVRAETSPDDVHGMAKSAGILTARGGLASHAAVVARGWGIPAVVGVGSMEVEADRVTIGERVLVPGDVITIDGSTGEVFAGEISGTTEVVPEARKLRDWARELGIAIGEEASEDGLLHPGEAAKVRVAEGVEGRAVPAVTLDDCVRAIAIKGFATSQGVADAMVSTPESVQPLLDQLALDGLAATVAGAYRLTGAGKARAEELLAAARIGWGLDRAATALDAFLTLDHRMKDAVTAWQLRGLEGAQSINDHSDAAYDRTVLERLAALHAETVAWIGPLEPACPHLARYRMRLTGALEKAVAGDQRYVASPRVDSYHGIWFELHEDLILLAGRTRGEEVAAGRA